MHPPFKKGERLVPYKLHQKYPHKRRDMTSCVDQRARRYFVAKYVSRPQQFGRIFDDGTEFTDDQIEG